MKRSNEAFLWSLFSAGGVMAALFVPALVLVTGLVLPFLGPSNPRDAFGKHLVDNFFDPFGLWLSDEDLTNLRYGITALKAVDGYGRVKDDLEKVRKTSVD